MGRPLLFQQNRPEAVSRKSLGNRGDSTCGSTNASQHAGFQTLSAHYDHVLPHTCGGTNDLDHLVVSCAASNFGKMPYRLEERGLADPRERPSMQSQWDGLNACIAPEPVSLGTLPLALAVGD